ncbi:MAG: hypothetical protein M3Z75_28510, partial [Actinomycetota bacterium]|nr:hypothetical protein [Actinomycetota bacterium]
MVLNEQDSYVTLPPHPHDHLRQRHDLLVDQSRGQLVEQQQTRLRQQRAGELDPLEGAEREAGHLRLRQLLDLQPAQQLQRPFPQLALLLAAAAQPEGMGQRAGTKLGMAAEQDVVQDRRLRPQHRMLK